ncbi:hypothetical protein [Aporhodopirellula aestuarii]|uniref:Uncharacterized protein n=1 Tax=Aporhodopirellula aestuarii TaxID=2950107 RepID=A0ABT0UD29_9BACT|nr:hypothetical protein [Aporhodopirellula aestuarii]MCM2374649.1 hypothetical protein [Aporhodopirellula aestuarii]
MLKVYLFEDNDMDYAAHWMDEVIPVDGSLTREVYGVDTPVAWHPVWNNFPSAPLASSQICIPTALRIRDNADVKKSADQIFVEALDSCCNASGLCLFFFDMEFKLIELETRHLDVQLKRMDGEDEGSFALRQTMFRQRVDSCLAAATGKSKLSDQLKYLNENILHGMLLVVHALANEYVDADFILATQKTPKHEVGRLRNVGRDVAICHTLSKNDHGETPAEEVHNALDEFCKKRTITLKNLFWPEYSKNWFTSKSSEDREKFPIPHDFPVFAEWYKGDLKLDSELATYLRRLAAYGYRLGHPEEPSVAITQLYESLDADVRNSIDQIVLRWLEEKWVYEALKAFVGGRALLGTGENLPTTATFIFPLLASTGPVAFAREIARMKPDNMCPEMILADKESYQRVIKKSFFLFKSVVRDEGGAENSVTASLDAVGDFGYFSVEVGLSCVRGVADNDDKQPLLSMTQLPTKFHNARKGETLDALNAFQNDCFLGLDQDRSVFNWVLPGKSAGATEFKIGVVKRV